MSETLLTTFDGQHFRPLREVYMQDAEEAGYRCFLCREMIELRTPIMLMPVMHPTGVMSRGPLYLGWAHKDCADDRERIWAAADRHREEYVRRHPDKAA